MKDQAFFLPLKTRPKELPPLQKMVGRFWHTGIIHNGKVYECFNHERNSITGLKERQEDLTKQKAVFVDIDIPEESKIISEIKSGTDCSEYVARVIGMSSNTGAKKEYWPEEVYDFIQGSSNES